MWYNIGKRESAGSVIDRICVFANMRLSVQRLWYNIGKRESAGSVIDRICGRIVRVSREYAVNRNAYNNEGANGKHIIKYRIQGRIGA
ncbi:hypothetical protein FACS1894133_6200 [Clostridia bacterium]|nr:hypothetical protein FACS1894133_6200 [Clostridia bacterium]